MIQQKFSGHHLMLDCAKCQKKLIKNETNIKNFIDEVVNIIDMKKLGNIHIENLQTGPINLRGISVVQLINTSSIVAHFVQKTGNAYLDVFSCKSFNNNDIISCFEKYFKPKKIITHFLLRNVNKFTISQ